MMDGVYTDKQLRGKGFRSVGTNVLISKKASIYGCKDIILGNNIRIDDYCVISANGGSLILEGYNHIGALTYLNSTGNITMKTFAGIAPRCSIYSATNTYDGSSLTGPLVPEKFVHVIEK